MKKNEQNALQPPESFTYVKNGEGWTVLDESSLPVCVVYDPRHERERDVRSLVAFGRMWNVDRCIVSRTLLWLNEV